MKHIILFVFLFLSIGLFGQSNKTLLAIFPHPDDEMAVAEVLIKYAKLGYKVQLIIATDGKYGTRVTNIPEGDSLGAPEKRGINMRLQNYGHRGSCFPGN